MKIRSIITPIALTIPFVGFGFDTAKTIPAGVSRIMVNTTHTSFTQKTDSDKNKNSSVAALDKSILFEDFAKALGTFEAKQLRAFLLSQGISDSESVGQLSASFEGQINAYAPSYAYGVSDKLTIGFAVPIIQAATDVKTGFTPNETGKAFIANLNRPELGLRDKVPMALSELNNVPDRLNQTLTDNGYDELDSWEGEGIGDVLLKGKYLASSKATSATASVFGARLPTGKTDDPDNLTDIALGDGSLDLFAGIVLDQYLSDSVSLNQSLTYTAQLPSTQKMRLPRRGESFAAKTESISVDHGDIIDADLSVQYDGTSGLQSGLGYLFQHRFADDISAPSYAKEVESASESQIHAAQALLGYSTVGLYKRGKSAVPMASLVMYEKQLQSRNRTVADLVKLEVKLFF